MVLLFDIVIYSLFEWWDNVKRICDVNFVMRFYDTNLMLEFLWLRGCFGEMFILGWYKSEKSIDFTGNIGVLMVENLIGKMVFWVNFYLIILEILGEFEKS